MNVFLLGIFPLTHKRSCAVLWRAAASSPTVLEGKVMVLPPPLSPLAVSYGKYGLVSSLSLFLRNLLVFLNISCSSRTWHVSDFSPQFHITKENRGNEGTCVGVSRWPVKDHNHHTTTDMWLYRAYSGNLYHGGELVRSLPSFTQGDTITCILDMEAHTISFAKNDKVSWHKCWSKGFQSTSRGARALYGRSKMRK